MVVLSIVVPMRNEAGNVAAVLSEVSGVMAAGPASEIIVVDDASTDDTAERVRDLQSEIPNLRLIRHAVRGGQSAAVHNGVLAAAGEVICTLDGDGQNPAVELPRLYAPILADRTGRVGLVAGQRVGRRDTVSKKLASRFANALRGWMLNDGTRDSACGLKAFRRDAFLALPYFDHMHRFLPALFKRDGWEIRHVDVSHRERRSGTSNYSNLQRGLVGITDLIGVAWLIRRRKKAVPAETTVARRRMEAAE